MIHFASEHLSSLSAHPREFRGDRIYDFVIRSKKTTLVEKKRKRSKLRHRLINLLGLEIRLNRFDVLVNFRFIPGRQSTAKKLDTKQNKKLLILAHFQMVDVTVSKIPPGLQIVSQKPATEQYRQY